MCPSKPHHTVGAITTPQHYQTVGATPLCIPMNQQGTYDLQPLRALLGVGNLTSVLLPDSTNPWDGF